MHNDDRSAAMVLQRIWLICQWSLLSTALGARMHSNLALSLTLRDSIKDSCPKELSALTLVHRSHLRGRLPSGPHCRLL